MLALPLLKSIPMTLIGNGHTLTPIAKGPAISCHFIWSQTRIPDFELALTGVKAN
jgi:hypothetical protein